MISMWLLGNVPVENTQETSIAPLYVMKDQIIPQSPPHKGSGNRRIGTQ
jgi:hypothetical protein